jgi:hypothetical protein
MITAEEFLIRQGCQRMDCDGENCNFFEDVQPKDLVEFAKLHVEQALKEASENAFVDNNYQQGSVWDSDDFEVNKESILNAYPLTNII